MFVARILCADISGGQENFPVPVVCDPEDEDADAMPPREHRNPDLNHVG